jgi:hypothetical protein
MEVCHLAMKGKRDGFPGSCSLYLILERNTSGFHDVCTTLPSGLEKEEIILVSIQFRNTHNVHLFYIKPLIP